MGLVYDVAAGPAQKCRSIKPHKAAQGSCTSKAKENKGKYHQQPHFRAACLLCQGNKALEHHPLSYQTAGKRHGGKSHGTNQGKEGSIRHLLQKATHFLNILAAGSMHNSTGTHKHKALHQAMAKGVNHSCRKGHNGQRCQPHGHHQHATAKYGKDNAHILHGGIGQNPLHIHLHGSIKNAQEGR